MSSAIAVRAHRTIYGRLRSIGNEALQYLLLHNEASDKGRSPTDGKVDRRVTDHFERKSSEEIKDEYEALQAAANDGSGQMDRIIPNAKGQWWYQLLRSLDRNDQPPASNDEEWAEWRRFVTAQCFDLVQVSSTLFLRAAFGEDASGSREQVEKFAQSLDAKAIEEAIKRCGAAGNDDGFFVKGISIGNDAYDLKNDMLQIAGTFPKAYIASLKGQFLEDVLEHPATKNSGIRIIHAEQFGNTLLVETDAHDERNTVSYLFDPKGLLATDSV